MQSTKLSTIISRLDRYQTLSVIEDQFKVRDIDEALRTFNRNILFPWALKKGSLKIFDGVLEYPVEDDHRRLAFIDTSKDKAFMDKMQAVYTSIKEFYENPNERNDVAEIWDEGEKYLGVRYDSIEGSSQLVDDGEDSDNYTASDDATSVEEDGVIYKSGNGSIKLNVTKSADLATITCNFTSFGDSDYKEKYFFVWVYLASVPDSIDLKFGNDASNYLTENLTTQFSGQALKAGQWNLVAINLDEATEVGTIDYNTFDYWAMIINGVSTGAYYIDKSHIRAWELMDYWYYSNFNVKLVGSSSADQKYFFNSSEVYSTDSELIGEDEFIDCVMFEAGLIGIDEKENKYLAESFRRKQNEAWNALMSRYPDLEPLIITSRYNFINNPNE